MKNSYLEMEMQPQPQQENNRKITKITIKAIK